MKTLHVHPATDDEIGERRREYQTRPLAQIEPAKTEWEFSLFERIGQQVSQLRMAKDKIRHLEASNIEYLEEIQRLKLQLARTRNHKPNIENINGESPAEELLRVGRALRNSLYPLFPFRIQRVMQLVHEWDQAEERVRRTRSR